MWWISVFVFLFLMALIFRSIEWFLQKIPSEIETKNVKDLPVKQSKEAGAPNQGTLIKRKRVMESENSPKRKSAISETSEITDSYGKSISVTKTESSQISRVMESENSAKRKSAISETSEITDRQSYGKSMSVTKTESSQISSDYFSEETEICKDKKGVVFESIQDAKTCHDESNSSREDLEFDGVEKRENGNFGE
ncbi:uncharacterized protein LOC132738029 [Ruditapes philippinarum]|uniref:uncharacterized protein LOC132738029 n=1 Tax=Ruditapes philippinarum TaxID=129788 RepID=UPI00295B2A8F|nr:uncharacterized protein LOC132738029 [Ruditapes philippinarum]